MRYFAYGSNMWLRRLRSRDRAPSAVPLGTGRLDGYVLTFHKRGRDGSGKCSVLRTGDSSDTVFGVVFEVDERDRDALNRAEGDGYHPSTVDVTLVRTDEALTAELYVARRSYIDETLRPFDWYKAFVLAGAREHSLPEEYVGFIERRTGREDPDRERVRRQRTIFLES